MSKTRWFLLAMLVVIGVAWTPVFYKVMRWWAWQTYQEQVDKRISYLVKQECLK